MSDELKCPKYGKCDGNIKAEDKYFNSGTCGKCGGLLHLEDEDCNCKDFMLKDLKERCLTAEFENVRLKAEFTARVSIQSEILHLEMLIEETSKSFFSDLIEAHRLLTIAEKLREGGK